MNYFQFTVPVIMSYMRDSKRRLQELGYVPFGEKKAVISPQKGKHMSFGKELEEGYYEVEEVLE